MTDMRDPNMDTAPNTATPTPVANPNVDSTTGAPATMSTPNFGAQPTDNSNAPDASTPAAKSIPENLINNPAVPTQKMAAQADARKNSPAPDHKWLHDAAVELSGGPQYRTTYDANGNATRTEVPVSAAHLGLAIALEVLRGGLAGGNAKNTVEAAQKGAAVADQQRAAVKQANLDQDAQAKADQNHKLAVVKNNLETHQLAMNVGKQDLEMNQAYVDGYKDTANMLEKHQDLILGDVPEDQIQAGLKNGTYNVTKNLFIPHGDPVAILDPATGEQKEVNGVPVWGHNYYVVDAKAKGVLTQELQDQMYKVGKLRNSDGSRQTVPTNSEYPMSAIGKYAVENAQIQTAEEQLERHKNDILGDNAGPRVNLADTVAKDPAMMDAVKDYSRFIGAGEPDQVLGAMMANGKGQSAAKLMNFMGITPDDVRKAENKRLEEHTGATTKPTAEKESEEAARFTLGKANVDPNKPVVNGMQGGHKLTADEQTAYNVLNGVETGKANLKAKEAATTKATQDAEIVKAAHTMVDDPYNIASIRTISSMKGDERLRLFNAATDYAKSQGKTFDQSAADRKAKMLDSYENGKQADNIQSYQTFIKHAGDLYSTVQSLDRPEGTPKWIDKPLNWLEQNASSDPAIGAYLAKFEPVRDEILTFLKNNHAALQMDAESMNKVLDPSQSPRYIESTVKSLAQTGQYRLDSINSRFKHEFKKDYDGLYDDESRDALKTIGISPLGVKPPNPADIVKSGTLNGQKVFQLKDGNTVYADGSKVQ